MKPSLKIEAAAEVRPPRRGTYGRNDDQGRFTALCRHVLKGTREATGYQLWGGRR